jgi:hypothetical protein
MPLQMKFSWPTPQEKGVLIRQLLKIAKMHWFINGTMVEIWKPWKEKAHYTWFNGQKYIHVVNIILDHYGLLIYI